MNFVKYTATFTLLFIILISCNEINWNLNEKPILEKARVEQIDSNSCEIAIDFIYLKSKQLNPNDILELHLYLDTNANLITSIVSDQLNYGKNSFFIENLSPNTTYYFKCLAKNNVGKTETKFHHFTTYNTGGLASVATSNYSISNGTVNLFGELNNMGASTVNSLGFCLSTSSNPTITNTVYNVPILQGAFNFSVSNLQSNTTYYFRAYAKNSYGVSYGKNISFKTPLIPISPSVSTNSPTNLTPLSTACSVKLNGTISNAGSSSIINSGFLITTNQSAIQSGTQLNVGTSSGSFSYTATNLLSETNYFARAFAQNSEGISYGDIISFITPSLLALGDNYQGGIIGYIYQPGDQGFVQNEVHGIIVADDDQIGYTGGFNDGVDYTTLNGQYYGANLSGLGNAGQQNTTILVNSIGSGNYAAKICSDLVLNGYSDWYLPTVNECQKIKEGWMQTNLGFTGGLNHWTSTENNTTNAFQFTFIGMVYTPSNVSKTTNGYVRAVRRF